MFNLLDVTGKSTNMMQMVTWCPQCRCTANYMILQVPGIPCRGGIAKWGPDLDRGITKFDGYIYSIKVVCNLHFIAK